MGLDERVARKVSSGKLRRFCCFFSLLDNLYVCTWPIFGSPLYPKNPFEFSGVLNVTH